MKIQIGNSILFVAAIIVVFSILMLNINTFYWADDYSFMNELKKYGIIKNCIIGYNNWDGRYLTIACFFQSFFLQYVSVNWVTFFWNLCFLSSGFIAFYIIKLETEILKFGFFSNKLVLLSLAIIFWFGCFIFIPEIIYWATGGVYSLCLLQGAVWMYCFLKFQKTTFSIISKIGFLLFSITAGATSINYSIGFLALIVITIFSDFYHKKNQNTKFNSLVFISILIGFLFIVLAPGNYVRLHALGSYAAPSYSIFSLLKNFLFVFFKYSFRTSLLALLSMLLGFWMMQKSIFNLKNVVLINFQLIKKQKVIANLLELKWFFVALATVLPFVTMPIVSSARTTIFFAFFMMLFIVISTIKLIVNNNLSEIPNANSHNNINSFMLIVFIGIFTFVGYNFYKGIALKKEITKREKLLKNPKINVVKINRIDPTLASRCYQFTDFPIEKNDQYWITECQERYFKKKIIVEK